ncbi:MAG: 4Fe-4S binding protein [Desulfomonile tiedjei]|uniref:4Fe-4S binding protein n=1 Tax=Desulfomonile tiedjei TaxID=2358 RepID=A0A9D6Z322_9BACT|nr:4Fe-4S binding protein [Desulfomonile tiedjei]
MTKYSLIIDNEACWGCRTCEAACGQEYDFRTKFMTVTEEGPSQGDGMTDYMYRVNVCRHCDDPPCIPACPEDAITKRGDGLVILNREQCSGCQSCLEACPYGVIWFNEPDQRALKCNMCHHRVDQGLMPACADNVCLAHCIYFGDPESIQEVIERKKQKRQTK